MIIRLHATCIYVYVTRKFNARHIRVSEQEPLSRVLAYIETLANALINVCKILFTRCNELFQPEIMTRRL